MKLEKLSLQGFKSFRERTIISFDDGVTGIVGPNGCGKSNIVDALFWVMGEQSAKHLRGDKMSDLIFNGTDKYSASSFAEVTLTLSNTHLKHIHIGSKVVQPEKIELSRKLYRNGETEYRINGMPSRLKDIQEVFMDTGAGAKSYSVIAQGEIDRLVRAKPEDRRVMIDEVAGITKFKHRRKESVKKIEQTQSNLERLSDLQKEVHKNLKDLEQQAQKAKRAKLLREKVQHHSLIVSSHKEHDFLEKIFQLKEKISLCDVEITSLKNNCLSIELTMEDEQLKKLDLMEQLDSSQKELTEIGKQLSSKEDEIKFTEISLKEKKKLIEERRGEINQVEDEIKDREERKVVVQKELEEFLSHSVEDVEISSLEESMELLKSDLEKLVQEKNQLQMEKRSAQEKMQEVSNIAFKHQAKLEQLSSDLQEVTQEIDLLEVQTGIFADETQGKRELLKELESRVLKFKQSKEETQKDFKSVVDQIEIDKEKMQQIQTAIVSLESKNQSLREVNDTEMKKKGSQSFFQEDDKRFEAYSLISDLITCDQENMMALQRTLSSVAEYVAISNNGSGNEVISWISKNNANMDVCLDMNYNVERGSDLSNYFTSLSEIAFIENKDYSKFADTLLKNRWVSSNRSLDEVIEVLKDKNFYSVVDAGGKFLVYKKDGLILVDSSYSENENTAGLLERSIKIKQNETALIQETDKFENLKDCLCQLMREKEVKELNLNSISESLERNTEQLIALRSELQAQEGGLQVGASRLEVLKNKKNDLSVQRLNLLEQDESISLDQEAADEALKNIDQSVYEKEEEIQIIKGKYEDLKDKYLQKKTFWQTKSQQERNLKSQFADIEQRILALESKRAHYLTMIDLSATEIINFKELTAKAKNDVQSLTEQLEIKENITSGLKEELDQILSEVGDREKSVKEMNKKISILEKDVVESKLKYDQLVEEEEVIVRSTFEQYRIDLRKSLSSFFSYSVESLSILRPIDSMYVLETIEGAQTIVDVGYVFEKKFPAQVKESQEKARRYNAELNNIGEINWTADEEYERQKIRYEFLCDQELELKKSIEDLNSAISLIDEKSILRFKMAYEEINDKFSKVFPIIFGGGNASLQLTTNPEDPDCGVEIIAQPPGKKMQNINLMSGGEKALTAVSLIFSIFLIKPSPFCLLDEVDAPLDDANVGRFNELLREMSTQSQFILITHNKKTMELNDTLYGITMQEPGVSKALSVQLH